MKDAWKEKQFRRIENARAKREMIDNQIAKERHQEVVNKVQRIRELSVVKDTAIKERRNNALRHQEILREFLAKEANNKVDERPLSHLDDRSASGYRQSENQSVGAARMFSASASGYDNNSAFGGSRPKSRTGGDPKSPMVGSGNAPFSTSAKRTTEPAMWHQGNMRNVGNGTAKKVLDF